MVGIRKSALNKEVSLQKKFIAMSTSTSTIDLFLKYKKVKVRIRMKRRVS